MSPDSTGAVPSPSPLPVPGAPGRLPVGPEYDSVDSVVSGLTALQQVCTARHDRRAIFLSAYLLISQQIKQRIEQKFFRDNQWLARYLVSFGNFYRKALADFESGNLAAVPKAWLVSFQVSQGGSGLLMQDLLLGINAHINHDLALALNQVTIDPNRPVRYQDHTAVNEVLRSVTDQLKQRIESLYAPGLELLDKSVSSLDDELANFSIDKARESAWESAVALANAQNDQERAAVSGCLDDRSAVLAQLLMLPTTEHPVLVPVLRQIEVAVPWWERILNPEIQPTGTNG